MEKESRSNLVEIHQSCADQRQVEWQKKNKNLKLKEGDFVKLGFPFKHPVTRQPTKEHMWVEIKTVGDEIITGIIANDPCFIDANYGDTVIFSFDEISDYMKGE